MNTLKPLQDFVRFINDFRLVRRNFLVRGREDDENDAEHSYQMAVCAWFVNEHYKLGFDTNKLLRYGLIHDIVEVYAGDTPAFGGGSNARTPEEKHRLEMEAFARIKTEWEDNFPEMVALIEAYEAKNDRESLFIYALDKIIPKLNNLEDETGRNWHREQVSMQYVIDYTDPKVAKSPPLIPLWELVKEEMAKYPQMFPSEKTTS